MEVRKFLMKIFRFFVPLFLRKSLRKIYFKLEWWFFRLYWLYFYGEFDFFNSVAMEINSYCQLRCSICPNSLFEQGLKKNEIKMSMKLIHKIVDSLARVNYRGRIVFSRFNDPLTDDRLFDIALYVRQKLPKAKIQIVTNGLKLTEKTFLTLRSIGVKKFFVTKYTPKDVGDVVEILKKYKNTGITYRHLTENDPLVNRGGLIKAKVEQDLPCQSALFAAIIINASGKVLKCCNDYHSEDVMGDVNEQDLMDIWFGETFRETRRNLRKQNFVTDLCKRCTS